MDGFRLLMLSAMYENGGNITHRFFDGHPRMFVYPFESQLGTRLVNDHLSSLFPAKYRWPVFPLESEPRQDYLIIIDEECKVRARTPWVSKFADVPFEFSEEERCNLYVKYVDEIGRSRPNNVASFFRSTFDAWKNYNRSGKELIYVGYSPVIVVDADKILSELPSAHMLHVVRNPWSAFADTKKRPVPLPLFTYITLWAVAQYHALIFERLYPGRLHILRYEDIIGNPEAVLGKFCEKIGLSKADTLGFLSWNGEPLETAHPWGTIRNATPEANRKTARELSTEEREKVRLWSGQYPKIFGYEDFLKI